MDSKKRRLEINRWDHPNFPESQTLKLFDWYILCKCDNVGVYGHNKGLAEYHCGGQIDLDKYLEIVNSESLEIERLTSNKLWVKNFVRDTWGTIAPGNNMGKSAYKLLHKHGLLERFISEYPSCIKISDFREYIIEGKGNGYEELPLPQGSPNPASVNTAYEDRDVDSLPQGNAKPAANNIPSNDNNSILNQGSKARNDGINNVADGSYSSPPDSLVKAESILGVYPIRHKDGSDISLLSTIQEVLELLEAEDISNPVGYLIAEIESLDRKQTPPPQEFFESLLHGEEIPF